MNPIGGYFEWEFPPAKRQQLHENAVYLNSGRHALEYILKGLGKVNCLWIPYFTCDVVLQPLIKLNIPHKFYKINKELEIAEEIALGNDEYLLYTNYYGMKDAYIQKTVATYGDRLIVDNAQALYCDAIATHQFYSPRKFMGMPDGGLAVTGVTNIVDSLPIDNSNNRCSHLLKRHELVPFDGYNDFRQNSKKIAEAPLSQMSPISRQIFGTVDLEFIKQRRRENFKFLHMVLKVINRMQIPPMDTFACPLVYPYSTNNGNSLKKKLIEKNIFVASYWPNVFEWCKPTDLEYELADHVVCIPIDQRYGKEEMEIIIKEIEK